MNDAEILLDIKRRHSRLHYVDGFLTDGFTSILNAQKTCYEIGLSVEFNAACEALILLHDAVKAKWEKGA